MVARMQRLPETFLGPVGAPDAETAKRAIADFHVIDPQMQAQPMASAGADLTMSPARATPAEARQCESCSVVCTRSRHGVRRGGDHEASCACPNGRESADSTPPIGLEWEPPSRSEFRHFAEITLRSYYKADGHTAALQAKDGSVVAVVALWQRLCAFCAMLVRNRMAFAVI